MNITLIITTNVAAVMMQMTLVRPLPEPCSNSHSIRHPVMQMAINTVAVM